MNTMDIATSYIDRNLDEIASEQYDFEKTAILREGKSREVARMLQRDLSICASTAQGVVKSVLLTILLEYQIGKRVRE